MGGEVPEESWNKLFEALRETLKFSPEALAQVEVGQLHLMSEGRETNRHLGQLWRAVTQSTSRTDIPEYRDPPLSVAQEWDAFRLAQAAPADSASASDFGKLSS